MVSTKSVVHEHSLELVAQLAEPIPNDSVVFQTQSRFCSAGVGTSVDFSDRPILCSAANWQEQEVVFGSADHALYVLDTNKLKQKRQLYNKTNGHKECVPPCLAAGFCLRVSRSFLFCSVIATTIVGQIIKTWYIDIKLFKCCKRLPIRFTAHEFT